MPAPAPYIPTRQADLDAWSQNFSTLITASPSTYGLVAADATAIAGFVNSFHTDLALATNPITRTPPIIAAKDAAGAAMLDICRGYAIQIRNNAGVSNMDKAALGLTIPTLTPTPIAAPTTTPLITILGAQSLLLTLQYRDSATPTTKAKPFGAISLEMHAVTSATVINNPDIIPYVRDATKSPFTLSFISADIGKVAYICGRWKTRTGLVGPWSTIVTSTII